MVAASSAFDRVGMSENGEKPDSSVYIGNVPFGATDEALAELFADFRLQSCKVVKTHKTGRSRGFAIAKFSDQAEADNAIKALNETEFNGRKIYLKPDERTRVALELNDKDAISTTVFLTNIPYSSTSESLKQNFAGLPGLQEAVIGADRRTGRSRGYAVLSFDTSDNAKSAIETVHNTSLDGRTVSARLDYGSRLSRKPIQEASNDNPEQQEC